MTSHLGLLVLFAVFVSIIFAALMRDDPREQLRFGVRLLAGFVGAALVLSWLMYPLPL
jgi:galactitol-specific phosphotransferase system IIC component